MILGRVGVQSHDDFSVTDSSNNLVTGVDSTAFTYYIFDPSDNEVSGSVSVSIIELGNGYYRLKFTPNTVGVWTVAVHHPTYFPWGKTGSVQIFSNDFDTIETLVTRILGLVQEDFYIDNTTYDSYHNMLTSRIRIYSNPASVGTGSNVIATYVMNATYDTNGNMETYKVVKQ